MYDLKKNKKKNKKTNTDTRLEYSYGLIQSIVRDSTVGSSRYHVNSVNSGQATSTVYRLGFCSCLVQLLILISELFPALLRDRSFLVVDVDLHREGVAQSFPVPRLHG